MSFGEKLTVHPAVQKIGFTIVTHNGTTLIFRTDVNAMSAKTGSSWVKLMNSISVMGTALKKLVWRKPLTPTLTVTVEKETQMIGCRPAIIDKLCKVVDGVITIKQFSDWFVPFTKQVSPDDEAAGRLIHKIKLCFAEYSNGTWDTVILRERLIDLIL